MRVFLLLSLLLNPRLFGAACCVGGSPKTFLSLQRLQKYELGLSNSFRDVYGNYNPFGDLVEADKNQSLTLSLGADARLTHFLEAFFVFPWVYQTKQTGSGTHYRSTIGDLSVGARWMLLESLFQSDWYPTVGLVGGVKAPTGSVESVSSEGRLLPGTGTGNWEPYLALELKKDYAPITVVLAAGLTVRLSRNAPDPAGGPNLLVRDGNRMEFSETVSYALSRRLNIALGSNQFWELDRSIDGSVIPFSSSRAIGLALSSSYFFTQFLSLTGAVDFSIPRDRLGVNQQASRTFNFTVKQGFY